MKMKVIDTKMMAQYDWVHSGSEPSDQPNTYEERKEKNPKYMYSPLLPGGKHLFECFSDYLRKVKIKSKK